MKRSMFIVLFALLSVLVAMTGCGTPASQVGSVSFKVDLSALTRASATAEITRVAVTLTREGYDPVARDLPIVNNTASGDVYGLIAGYWHVVAIMEDSNGFQYKGEADVAVQSAAVTPCQIYFDPDPVDPSTGGLTITVGWNPMPGYTFLNQQVGRAFVDGVQNQLYIVDELRNILAVYEPDTIRRVRDIPLAPPNSGLPAIAQTFDKAAFLLGFQSGEIKRLEPATGQTQLLTTAPFPVGELIDCAGIIVVVKRHGFDTVELSSLDGMLGQVQDTVSIPVPAYEFVYNTQTYSLYFSTSRGQVGCIRMNGGMFSEPRYYAPVTNSGSPCIFANGTRVAYSLGDVFTCSAFDTDDLGHFGMIEPYYGLACDDYAGYLYLGTYQPPQRLQVIRQSDLTVRSEIALGGQLMNILNTTNSVVVIVFGESGVFAKAFNKASLGIPSPGVPLP